jgi:hypothetical protein
MKQQEIERVLEECEFKLFDTPFQFLVMPKGDGFLLQLEGYIKDNETHQYSWQKGGKHYLSSYCIKDEIVNKAWKACFDFIIHEARESFYYKEQTIYHPHFLVDELATFVNKSEHAKRNNYIKY